MLSPETMDMIRALAADLHSMFAPSELIAGCEVLSVADKDEYAANNGWIEARVGRHNNQRCRWRGQFPDIQAGDFVDVLYFASYRLFTVLGQGGAGAIKSFGGAWPKAGKLTISDAKYDTVAAAIAAASSGSLIKSGEGTFVCDGETLSSGVNVLGSGQDVSNWTSNAPATLSNASSAVNVLRRIFVTNTNSSAAYVAFNGAAASFVRAHGCTFTATDNAGSIGIVVAGAATLVDCEAYGGGASVGLSIVGSGVATIVGGNYDGIDVAAAGATLFVYGARVTGAGVTNSGGGTILGWYIDAATGETIYIADVNLNGNTLVLDADGDTSISAATDDSVEIEAGGALKATVNQSGLIMADDIFLAGNAVFLDADEDTIIESIADDLINFWAGGAVRANINASGLALAAGARVDDVDTVPANDDTALITSGAVWDHTNASAGVHGLAANEHVLSANVAGHKVESGTHANTTSNISSATYFSNVHSVTFPLAFAATPEVVVATGQDGISFAVRVENKSTTGFNYRSLTSVSTATANTVAWIAKGS
jgi:hypothetical protein